jgi:hypothetical protein
MLPMINVCIFDFDPEKKRRTGTPSFSRVPVRVAQQIAAAS